MCERLGILRLVICYFLCVAIIFFALFNILNKESFVVAEKEEIPYFLADSVFATSQDNLTENNEKPQETPKEQTTSNKGEWIDKGWKGDWQFETDGRGNCWHEYECSECGFHIKGSKRNYCPNCGTDMRGTKDEWFSQ